jgi:hypothetical protein
VRSVVAVEMTHIANIRLSLLLCENSCCVELL